MTLNLVFFYKSLYAMKSCLFIALILIMSSLCTMAYAQSGESKDVFPTYEQIKQGQAEITIIQEVSESVTSRQNGNTPYKELSFSLIDLPEGATYIVNGKPLKNFESVERLLDQEKSRLVNISMGKASKDGKRIIEVNYVKP